MSMSVHVLVNVHFQILIELDNNSNNSHTIYKSLLSSHIYRNAFKKGKIVSDNVFNNISQMDQNITTHWIMYNLLLRSLEIERKRVFMVYRLQELFIILDESLIKRLLYFFIIVETSNIYRFYRMVTCILSVT